MADWTFDFAGSANTTTGGANTTTGTAGMLTDFRGGVASIQGGKLRINAINNNNFDKFAYYGNNSFVEKEGEVWCEFLTDDLATGNQTGPALATRIQATGGDAGNSYNVHLYSVSGSSTQRIIRFTAGRFHNPPILSGGNNIVTFNPGSRNKTRFWVEGTGASAVAYLVIHDLTLNVELKRVTAGGSAMSNGPSVNGFQGFLAYDVLNTGGMFAQLVAIGGSDQPGGQAEIVLADPNYEVTNKTIGESAYIEVTIPTAISGGTGSYTYTLKYGQTMKEFATLPTTCAPTVAGGRVFRIPKGAGETYVYYAFQIVSGGRNYTSTTTVEAFATDAPEIGVAGGDSMQHAAEPENDEEALGRELRAATGAWGSKVKHTTLYMETVPGSTAQQWATNHNNKLTDFKAEINTRGATFCMIGLGRNDATGGRTAVQFLADIATIIASVKADCPTITKILLLDTFYAKPLSAIVTEASNLLCQQYGAGMKADYASDPVVVFVDGLFEGIGRDPDLYLGNQTPPGGAEYRIHLSEAGMAFLGRQIAHYMLGGSGGGSEDGEDMFTVTAASVAPIPLNPNTFVKIGSAGEKISAQFTGGRAAVKYVAAGTAAPVKDGNGTTFQDGTILERNLQGVDCYAIGVDGPMLAQVTK